MEYRLASEHDLPQLAECRWAFWLEDGRDPAQQDYEAFSTAFIEWLAVRLGTSWFVWCAFDNDRVVSHIYVNRVDKLPKPSAPADCFGYVTNVYTQPGFRNRGIGTTLLELVKKWALETNLEFLVLWPSARSEPFWRRADFSASDALVNPIRPYIN